MGKVVKIVAGLGLVALGLFTGGIAFTGALAFLGTVSAGTLLAVGASILLGVAAQEFLTPKIPRSQLSRLNISMDPSAPRKAVFGTTAFPLDLRYHEGTGQDQEFIHYIIAHAAHKVKSIDEIWLEQDLAWTSSGGVTAKYSGYLLVTTRTEGAAGNEINISGNWGSGERLTGCAYTYLRIKRTGNSKKAESPLASGLPSRVTVVGEGAFLYDPRLDSTVPGGSGSHRANDQSTWGIGYSPSDSYDNPALQLLWWLLGWKINGKLSVGCGVPPERIDMQSFIAAANICDEDVTLSAGGSQDRYRSSGTASDEDDRMQVVNVFLSSMNGTLRDNGGRLSLEILKNDLAEYVVSFDDNDILGDFNWQQTRGLSDSYNVVRGRFVDPSNNSLYQMIDYPEVRIDSIDGIERVLSLDLPYIEEGRRAQRIAKQVLQRNQYRGTFSATFNLKALGCDVGEVVRISFEPLGWSNKLFRVISKEVRMDGQVPLTLIEENAAIYAWDNEESAVVTPTAPTVYDPLNSPFILAAAEAGTTADWPNVTGEGRPDDNATVGAIIPTPDSGETGNIRNHLGEVYDPGELLNTSIELTPDGRLQYRPLPDATPVERGQITLPDIGAASATAMRRAEDDVDALANALATALDEASRTRETFTDAGFFVDEATGQVRIHAIEQTNERISTAEVRLNAAEASINLRATTSYVDQAIAEAVLDPSQIADLDAVFVRLTAAEVDIDGLEATVTTLATVTELTALTGRVTTAENEIDALEGTVSTKVDTTTFDALETRVTSAESTLTAIGDVAQITNAVTATRLLERAVDANAEGALAALVQDDRNQRDQVAAVASARQELRADVSDGLAAEASARLALQVEVDQNAASLATESLTRASENAALASQITALEASTTASVNTLTASIQTEQTARTNADSALAADITTLTASLEAAETALTASIATANQARVDGDAVLAGQITTLSATLDAEVANLAAAISSETQARVTEDGALATSIASLDASFTVAMTAETQARVAAIAAEEANRTAAINAEADARIAAIAQEANNRGTAILAEEQARINAINAERTQTLADVAAETAARQAAITSLTASIQQEAVARADADTAIAGTVTTLTTTVNQNTATLVTFGSSIDGLQARQGVRLDVNGRITGYVQNNDGTQGDFTIVADNFRVVDPDTGAAFIDADDSGLRLRNGRVIMDNGLFIKAVGVGFGTTGQFIEWFGPRPTDGNLALCDEASALAYLKTDGSAYFGGSLSAGVIRNAARSSSIAANASTEIGPFGTNGNLIQVITGYGIQSGETVDYPATSQGLTDWDAAVTAWGATATGPVGNRSVNASKAVSCNVVVGVQRALGTGTPASFATLTITGGTETLVGTAPTPNDAPGDLTYTRTISGSITSTDNAGGIQNRTFTATITTRTNAVIGTIQSQTVSLTATEE